MAVSLQVAACSSDQSPEPAAGGGAGKAAGAAGSAAPLDGGSDGGGASGLGGAGAGMGQDQKAGTGGISATGGGSGGANSCTGALLNGRLDLECPENGRCVCRTYAPSEGELMLDTSFDANMSIVSFPLPQPMKAGELYSLSATITSRGYTGAIEFWGTNSVCGPGLQKLYGEPVESRTYCADVTPTQDFTHVLLVKRLLNPGHGSAAASEGPVLACGSSHCPATH